MQIDIVGNVSNFTSVDGDLVSQHAWGRDLNGIRPVVIVVAESVGEVQDSFLGDA